MHYPDATSTTTSCATKRTGFTVPCGAWASAVGVIHERLGPRRRPTANTPAKTPAKTFLFIEPNNLVLVLIVLNIIKWTSQ